MTNRSSFRVIMLLAFIAGSAQADYACEGPLEAGSWFVKPKIGVAPSIFAGRRARQQFVVPRAAQDQAKCELSSPLCNVDNFANTLQEGPCLPKFSDMFNQGVLHVGVELGYNVCDRSPWFLEFVYNRASGKCVQPCEYITNKATAGCTKNCNTDCNTDCTISCNDSCSPSGDSLSAICNLIDNYGNYSAYGAYIGGRYFTDPFWCDTTSWFFGYKIGILHRQAVEACSTLVVPAEGNDSGLCEANLDTQNIELKRAIFCKSNSISGGIQMGFDYCYNDCLSFQLGFEVVASCGLRGNRNHAININDIKSVAVSTTSLIDDLNLPSNILIRDSGALVNFPIWVGLKWEFGSWCDPCSPCDPCA